MQHTPYHLRAWERAHKSPHQGLPPVYGPHAASPFHEPPLLAYSRRKGWGAFAPRHHAVIAADCGYDIVCIMVLLDFSASRHRAHLGASTAPDIATNSATLHRCHLCNCTPAVAEAALA